MIGLGSDNNENVMVVKWDRDDEHWAVGLPNWHESGRHLQEQVGWGIRLALSSDGQNVVFHKQKTYLVSVIIFLNYTSFHTIGRLLKLN